MHFDWILIVCLVGGWYTIQRGYRSDLSEGRENKQLFHNLNEDNIKLTFNVAQILFSKSSIMDAIHTTKISSSEDGIEFKYFARVLTTYFDNMKPNVNISHTIKKLRCPGTREWLLTPVFFFFFHSRILAWRIPWTEEPGGLQSMGLQKLRN